MYTYITGYSTHEGSPDYVLLHEKNFSEEEFSEMLAEAGSHVISLWLARWTDEDAPDHPHYWVEWPDPDEALTRVEDLVPGIVRWLLREKGFKLLEPTVIAKFSGWARLSPGLDGFSLSDNEHNKRLVAEAEKVEHEILQRNKEIFDQVEEACTEEWDE